MSADDLNTPTYLQPPPERPALIPRRSADSVGAAPVPQHVIMRGGIAAAAPMPPAAAVAQSAPVAAAIDVDAAAPARRPAAPAAIEGRPGRAPVAAGIDPHEVAGVPRPEPRRAQLTGMDRDTEQAAELVIDLLDAVESLIVNGRRVPFSAAVMVNEDEALDYIDRARTSLPDDVKQARVIVERQGELIAEAEHHAGGLVAAAEAEVQRMAGAAQDEVERVLTASHTEAQRVTQTAREHAAALVSTHAITLAAEQRAEEIAAQAAADADAERAQADAYARDLLSGLAEQVEKALGQLHRGMEMLPPAMEPAAAVPGGRRRR